MIEFSTNNQEGTFSVMGMLCILMVVLTEWQSVFNKVHQWHTQKENFTIYKLPFRNQINNKCKKNFRERKKCREWNNPQRLSCVKNGRDFQWGISVRKRTQITVYRRMRWFICLLEPFLLGKLRGPASLFSEVWVSKSQKWAQL